jgi:Bacterial regulatory proteins, tetR family
MQGIFTIIAYNSDTMELKVIFEVNKHLYLRDPDSSELGKQIVKKGIELIHDLGFEQFTFKKLAIELGSTEASIYRYFENKHRLLLYILNWYWSYLGFLVMVQCQNVADPIIKLKTIISLLTKELQDNEGAAGYDKQLLNQIVIAESSKAYLVKDVQTINKEEVFKPYKELCGTIAAVMKQCNAYYKYTRSLSSTLIEASHQQQFFSTSLPKLTDCVASNKKNYATLFLEDLIFKVLGLV